MYQLWYSFLASGRQNYVVGRVHYVIPFHHEMSIKLFSSMFLRKKNDQLTFVTYILNNWHSITLLKSCHRNYIQPTYTTNLCVLYLPWKDFDKIMSERERGW